MITKNGSHKLRKLAKEYTQKFTTNSQKCVEKQKISQITKCIMKFKEFPHNKYMNQLHELMNKMNHIKWVREINTNKIIKPLNPYLILRILIYQ